MTSSHRAPVGVSESARRMVAPLAAVTAVVVVIVLLIVINHRPSHVGDAAVVVSPSPSPSLARTPAPQSTAPVTPAPVTPTPVAVAAPAVAPTAASPSVPVTAKAPVTVLNNSRRTGLAAAAAGQVRAAGWPVAQVGNFTGRISASTLYYAPGQFAAAQALARQLGRIKRVEPRFAGLPGHGLTLVVTRDWR